MDILRTLDERFEALPGFTWPPHYLDSLNGYEGLRIHRVDEGPSATAPSPQHNAPDSIASGNGSSQTFLCLHGEPTWSYLYRRMIPEFLAANHRVVAPDLPGFGRSDKPEDDGVYTFDFHRKLLLELIEHLDLRNIVLVCQDWGGLLGLTLPMSMPERFTGLLVMNTALGCGDVPVSDGFIAWRAYVAKHPDLDCGKLLARSCPHLTASEAEAYNAPFPDQRFKAGVRRFPALVPDRPDAPGAALSREARDWWQHDWRGQTMMAIGMTDPVLGPPVMHALRRVIRDCPEPIEIAAAGHFVQEWGAEVARRAAAEF